MNFRAQVRCFLTDIHIVVVQSSLDDRLIFAVGDDMVTERSERCRDDVHDRVHTQTSWSGDTDDEILILHVGNYRKNTLKCKTT